MAQRQTLVGCHCMVQGREEDRVSKLLIFTCCVLPVKNDLIHLVTNKGSPYEFNLCNNLLWEIESNAFLKSINIQSILSLLFSADVQSEIISSKTDWHKDLGEPKVFGLA